MRRFLTHPRASVIEIVMLYCTGIGVGSGTIGVLAATGLVVLGILLSGLLAPEPGQ